MAPEVAGPLPKVSSRPSPAPLPSYPSPNPPHSLTVNGQIAACARFMSTTLQCCGLSGSRVRLWAGGSRASQLALGSGSRRCRVSGDRSVRCCFSTCARWCCSSSFQRPHSAPCAWMMMIFGPMCTCFTHCERPCAFACAYVRVCDVRSADRPKRRKSLVCASNDNESMLGTCISLRLQLYRLVLF